MPSYQAENHLFVDGVLIPPGARFKSDLVPGRKWKPLDAAAKAAVEQRQAQLAKAPATISGVSMPDGTLRLDAFDRMQPATTEIPEDWRSLHQSQRRALAMKLGAPRQIKVPDADAMIEREVTRRAAAA